MPFGMILKSSLRASLGISSSSSSSSSSSIMRCILLIQHCGGGFFKISYEVLSCNIMFCENKILEQTNVLFC